jgi:hypothetical protein
VLSRFFALLLVLLGLETIVFVQTHEDLIALSEDPRRVAEQDEASLRALADATLSRNRLMRSHLDTLLAAARRRGLLDVETRSLERLTADYPEDEPLVLLLADAYRRAKRYDEAATLYRRLIEQVQR